MALDVLPVSSVLKTLQMSHLNGRRDARPGANRFRPYVDAIQAIVLGKPDVRGTAVLRDLQ